MSNEGAEPDHLAVLVVHQSGMFFVAPPSARMAVDVGKDLQRQLAAQVGYDVDPPACGGVPQPLAAAAGMHARHAVVVVAKSVEPVLGGVPARPQPVRRSSNSW